MTKRLYPFFHSSRECHSIFCTTALTQYVWFYEAVTLFVVSIVSGCHHPACCISGSPPGTVQFVPVKGEERLASSCTCCCVVQLSWGWCVGWSTPQPAFNNAIYFVVVTSWVPVSSWPDDCSRIGAGARAHAEPLTGSWSPLSDPSSTNFNQVTDWICLCILLVTTIACIISVISIQIELIILPIQIKF